MIRLRKTLEDYLATRQAFGFSNRTYASSLRDCVAFLTKQGATYVTTETALRWATKSGAVGASWSIDRLVMVRGFAKYLRGIDGRSEVPPLRLLPYVRSRRQPYIYTQQEIQTLMEAARSLSSPKGLRGLTYYTLLGLFWASGMRISEVLNLDRTDVDFREAVLTIHSSKFGKSRLVPVDRATIDALEHYAKRRNTAFPRIQSPSFFLTDIGTRPTRTIVEMTFVRLCRQVGIRGKDDPEGPRIHDIRHAFAVRTLIRLYRADLNVDWYLHLLAVYLGHVGVSSVYWYLSAVPELMELARRRLESKLGDLP